MVNPGETAATAQKLQVKHGPRGRTELKQTGGGARKTQTRLCIHYRTLRNSAHRETARVPAARGMAEQVTDSP